jgi:5,10-methylenetetrahydromethanopterin reductase
MELSCAFPFRPDLPEIAKEAESLGYERLWVYDSPALFGDIWMALTLCATSTSRIGLGTGVLVPSLRHPMVNAAAVASLEQLAPGRVVVGVGTGFTGRYVLGQPPMTWAATETYLEQFIGLLRGETVEVDGAPVRMMHPEGFAADRPLSTPVLVGANGPKGLAVAERVGADGVISIFGAQPGWDRCTLLMYGTVLGTASPSSRSASWTPPAPAQRSCSTACTRRTRPCSTPSRAAPSGAPRSRRSRSGSGTCTPTSSTSSR